MNHITLKSSKRWAEKGLFKDSEFVYIECTGGDDPIELTDKPVLRAEVKPILGKYVNVSFFPAPHCEELGLYESNYYTDVIQSPFGMWQAVDIAVNDDEEYEIEVIEEIEAKSETEAREKAINWDLDNRGE